MSRQPKQRSSAELSIAELEAMTADLDQEFIADKFGPLTPSNRRLWESIKRRRGRPKVGKGVKVVSVSIERDLLARADKAAKRAGVSRARLVAAGLRRVLRDLDTKAAEAKQRKSKRAA